MFASKPQPTPELDMAITAALARLDTVDFTSEEYAESLAQATKLLELKNATVRKSISPDTLAIVIGNLLGIVVIVGYERASIVTSKALQFVIKAKS